MQKIKLSDDLWDALLVMSAGGGAQVKNAGLAATPYDVVAGAKGRFVLAQVGQSLDGRVATPTGDARDVSGPDGMLHLHRCRALVDAVLVGVRTVQMDDPRLSVRLVKGNSPVRVVIDCRAELTGEEGLFHDGGAPVIVFQSTQSEPNHIENAEIVRLEPKDGGLDPHDILNTLSKRSLNRVLVEGGARTIARFVEAGLIDHLHVTISPVIIGSGPAGISLQPIDLLSSAHRPRTAIYDLGSDVLFDCAFKTMSDAR